MDQRNRCFCKADGGFDGLRQLPVIERLLKDTGSRMELCPIEHIAADEYVRREPTCLLYTSDAADE